MSCVEQGRWSWRDRRFSAAGHVVSPELRRHKAASLRTDALAPGVAQGAVWQTVHHQLAHRDVHSATAANADGFAARATAIDLVVRELVLEPGQCGVLASLSGQAWCLDAVSRPDVFARLHRKLVAGYVYDIIRPSGELATADDAMHALLRCSRVRRPSVAVGDDVRLEGEGVIASGLEVDGELVQLSAYGEPVCR
jgi:hypothetical protein